MGMRQCVFKAVPLWLFTLLRFGALLRGGQYTAQYVEFHAFGAGAQDKTTQASHELARQGRVVKADADQGALEMFEIALQLCMAGQGFARGLVRWLHGLRGKRGKAAFIRQQLHGGSQVERAEIRVGGNVDMGMTAL